MFGKKQKKGKSISKIMAESLSRGESDTAETQEKVDAQETVSTKGMTDSQKTASASDRDEENLAELGLPIPGPAKPAVKMRIVPVVPKRYTRIIPRMITEQLAASACASKGEKQLEEIQAEVPVIPEIQLLEHDAQGAVETEETAETVQTAVMEAAAEAEDLASEMQALVAETGRLEENQAEEEENVGAPEVSAENPEAQTPAETEEQAEEVQAEETEIAELPEVSAEEPGIQAADKQKTVESGEQTADIQVPAPEAPKGRKRSGLLAWTKKVGKFSGLRKERFGVIPSEQKEETDGPADMAEAVAADKVPATEAQVIAKEEPAEEVPANKPETDIASEELAAEQESLPSAEEAADKVSAADSEAQLPVEADVTDTDSFSDMPDSTAESQAISEMDELLEEILAAGSEAAAVLGTLDSNMKSQTFEEIDELLDGILADETEVSAAPERLAAEEPPEEGVNVPADTAEGSEEKTSEDETERQLPAEEVILPEEIRADESEDAAWAENLFDDIETQTIAETEEPAFMEEDAESFSEEDLASVPVVSAAFETQIPLEPEEEEFFESDEIAEDQEKHIRRMWLIPVLVAAFVVIAVVAGVLARKNANDADDYASVGSDAVIVEGPVVSETASSHTITTVLTGTGVLEEEDAVTMSIPEMVTISAYHVRNGETVKTGDIVASVDEDTVAAAMDEMQEVIDALDEQLAEESELEVTQESAMTTTAAGRIKAIYVEENVSVVDTMNACNALMLLSTDGKMAVQIASNEGLTAGDSVTVVYSDGTREKGQVDSVGDGIVTITVSDETADYMDEVAVYDDNGTLLGSGTLYIHQEQKVVSYYGTVSEINVSVNEQVEVGDTLMTLTYAGNTATYTALVDRRSELEEQLAVLVQYYTDGYIYAEADGVVSGIPDDANYAALASGDVSASNGSAEAIAYASDSRSAAALNTLSYSGNSGAFIVLLSADDTATETDNSADAVVEETAVPTDTPAEETAVPADPAAEETAVPTGGTETAAPTIKPEETETPEETAVPTAEPTAVVTATPGTSVPTVTPEPTAVGSTVPEIDGTETNYVAVVTSNEGNVLTYSGLRQMTDDITGLEDYEALDYNTLSALLNEGNGTGQCSYDDTTDVVVWSYESRNGNSVWTSSSLGDLVAGDLVLLVYTKTNTNSEMLKYVVLVAVDDSSGSAAGNGSVNNGNSSGISTGRNNGSSVSTGNAAATDGMTEEQAYVYETYSVEEKRVLAITPQNVMTVTITVDELVASELEAGMEAEVTLDGGQSFTGSVDSVDAAGTKESSYAGVVLEISVSRDPQMLAGSIVSVGIVTDAAEVDVAVPVAALVEQEGKTYVFTEYDASASTLSGLAEVETGMSDGDVVEIVSGLEKGDSYYYPEP